VHEEENPVDLKIEDETDKIINEILEHWDDDVEDENETITYGNGGY